MKSKILVIDDDSHCIESYQRILSVAGRELVCFQQPDEAVSSFSKDPFAFSVAFVDYQYRNGDQVNCIGTDIAKKLKELNPSLTVCLVSGDESNEALKSWLDSSIDNYIYKPLRKSEAMTYTEHHVLSYEKEFTPTKDIRRKESGKEILKQLNCEIIGESEAIIECARAALRFAKSDLNVLVLGETGTGKELFVKGIHDNSEMKSRGLHPINCSKYDENSQLLEVELFGSEKGAFTGAERKVGILELAAGGTVFLDEIHKLGKTAQAKLLRAIQEKKVRRVGGSKEYSVKFRLIAAGSPDLLAMCKTDQFLPDLYFRLKGLDIEIPPLRDRKRDIRPLVESFLERVRKNTGVEKQISSRTLMHLEKYDWPGNIRELLQTIEALHVMYDDSVIAPKHLPKEIKQAISVASGAKTLTELDAEYRQKQISLILETFSEVNHNFTEATKRLGLGDKRSTLRSRMKLLNIKDLNKQERTGLLNKLTDNFL